VANTRAQKATGSKDEDLSLSLVNQVLETLWLPKNMSEDIPIESACAAVATLEGIAPRDELEGLLAAQMVGAHNAAMECLRRAMMEGQTFDDQNLKHGARLLAIYTKQVEALDRHRGKGAQKITVEHVSVHAGRQAIVGNVEADRPGAPANEQAVPALENNPGPTMPTADLDNRPGRKTPQRVRSKRGS
jgi:hypothetical protein